MIVSYVKALRALREGRNKLTNPAHKEYLCFKEEKNPQWDRKSVDDHVSSTRALFMEENTDGEF